MELETSQFLTVHAALCEAYNALRGGQMTVPQLQNVLNLKLLVYSNISVFCMLSLETSESPHRYCSFSQLRLWIHVLRRIASALCGSSRR